jgi:hypothetical protein
MGKVLYTYAGFTAAQLKSRASIPSQGDIAVGANYIDCNSVDIPSEIRDVIGEGSNDLGTIYLSAKVNKWSGFGPREWYITGQIITDRPKSNPYDMANLCGYNHTAKTPYLYFPYPTNIRSSGLANTYINIGLFINLQEVDWATIWPNGTWFILANGVKVASFTTASVVGNSEINVVLSLLAPAAGQTTTYTIETWIGNTAGGALNGKLTQCSSVPVTVKISMTPIFGSITAADNQANRDMAVTKLGLAGSETVGRIWGSGTGLGFASTNITGTFTVNADISAVPGGAYKRTVPLCNTALMRGTLKAYKINAGVQSATYTVATLVRILPNQGFNYAVPAALLPITDDDVYYLYFDNLI